ncbi:hypothetical protein [Streptomyces sp. NPDC050564]|uniref:hypothetical protein n=1 Tax=Streptomyces sp. NPDC050564 TaxID=3365631 RepID=UPI0037B3EC63
MTEGRTWGPFSPIPLGHNTTDAPSGGRMSESAQGSRIHNWLADNSSRQQRDPERDQDNRTVGRLRLGVGVIGIMLPPAVPLGNEILRALGSKTPIMPDSISGSYYTGTRNVFVGSLCALGVFLICYRYNKRDDHFSSAAGAFALAVAFLPTSPGEHPTARQEAVGVIHLVCAALLLLMLAMFCILSFWDPAPTDKRHVNRLYLTAGAAIVAFTAIAGIAQLTKWGTHWKFTSVYICETLAVWAFGIAWLTAALEMGALRFGAPSPRTPLSADPVRHAP